MLKVAQRGSVGVTNMSDWSNEGIFVIVLNRFIKHTKPSQEQSLLKDSLLKDNLGRKLYF